MHCINLFDFCLAMGFIGHRQEFLSLKLMPKTVHSGTIAVMATLRRNNKPCHSSGSTAVYIPVKLAGKQLVKLTQSSSFQVTTVNIKAAAFSTSIGQTVRLSNMSKLLVPIIYNE